MNTQLNEWITVSDAAIRLGMSVAGIQARIRRGTLQAARQQGGPNGNHVFWCVKVADVESEIAARTNPISDTEAAWFAGFFDGDGCVQVHRQFNKKNITHTIAIHILSIDLGPLEWLQSKFGGFITSRQGSPKWAVGHRWTLTSRKAEPALRAILPYLRIKGPQARIALEMQERTRELGASRHHPVPQQEVEWRDKQKALLSAHNQRHRPKSPPLVGLNPSGHRADTDKQGG